MESVGEKKSKGKKSMSVKKAKKIDTRLSKKWVNASVRAEKKAIKKGKPAIIGSKRTTRIEQQYKKKLG